MFFSIGILEADDDDDMGNHINEAGVGIEDDSSEDNNEVDVELRTNNDVENVVEGNYILHIVIELKL